MLDRSSMLAGPCLQGRSGAMRMDESAGQLPSQGRRVAFCMDLAPMGTRRTAYEVLAQRRCLVCELDEDLWEAETEDEIGRLCSRCHAPTERRRILERRRVVTGVNPHAAALGRLGGLKGGHARAAKLTATRRRAIARAAARARWMRLHDVKKA
jgi:CRISPR/Cas system-associated protein Cas10 (large subunit of type III CRISPR-Cas system)